MPYDKIEPTQWWAGAEAAPPMPDEPGPWTLGATAYGWGWRRPEPVGRVDGAPVYAPGRVPVDDAPWSAADSLPDAPAEVRVGDRLTNGRVTWLVDEVAATAAIVTRISAPGLGAAGSIGLAHIGAAGSGKPWTLLPADPVPDADADTAGILREGLRALERIEAKAAAQVHAGGGGGNVRLAPDPRADDVRRVVEAARVFCATFVALWAKHDADRERVRERYVGPEMGELMDALAALDGEVGG